MTQAVPHSIPLVLIMDSTYIIKGLTTHLKSWKDIKWINIQNAQFFKKATHLLKQHSTTTHFQWVKGHSDSEGNEGGDSLAKSGMQKDQPDDLNLSIPIEFNL